MIVDRDQPEVAVGQIVEASFTYIASSSDSKFSLDTHSPREALVVPDTYSGAGSFKAYVVVLPASEGVLSYTIRDSTAQKVCGIPLHIVR